jgi:hypothetical protein
MSRLTALEVWGVWFVISLTLSLAMWRTPPMRVRFGWQGRLNGLWARICGDMAVGGARRIGIALAVVGWCGAAGMLVTDSSRAALGLGLGGGMVVAMFNAGRRADLSGPWCTLLGCALGTCVVGLLMIGEQI